MISRLVVLVGSVVSIARAQAPGGTLTFTVRSETGVITAALVRSGGISATTDGRGVARLTLPVGRQVITIARIGYRPVTLTATVLPGTEARVQVELHADASQLSELVVVTTRAERRLEDTPVRIEVVSTEEVAEKVQMSPGNIAHLLNETNGIRIQSTSPSLGGANVRIQGLPGRYTQILADGLPLYGGQTGNLGIVQIPPVDLLRVEIVKGVASALYGGQALGGVINLVSRPPTGSREALANQTTRDGTDLVGWFARPLGGRWSYTLLAGAHRQAGKDLDRDGWTDIAGYRRAVIRPRLFWGDSTGSTVLVTGGATLEHREGGTLRGATAPDGSAFPEGLETQRFDVGLIGRLVLARRAFLNLRGSAVQQGRAEQRGPARERDRSRTGLLEAAVTVPSGPDTWVVGGALAGEGLRESDVPGFDYTYTVPALFAQYDRDLNRSISLSASARADAHSRYGTFVSPRLSLLVRPRPGWSLRLSGGTGFSAPTPLVEATEVIGLRRVVPPDGLVAERGRGLSLDGSGVVGPFELNATVYGSRIDHRVQVRSATGQPGLVALINSPGSTRTWGGELLMRWRHDPITLSGSYTYLRSTESDPETARRQEVALNPRHSVGLVAVAEEGGSRFGLEGYYTGRQLLEENPYRTASAPYLLVGFLASRKLGKLVAFVNGENLLNVRLTEYQPLVRMSPGLGGRWTVDAWAPLEGRVVNAGVRVEW